MQGPEQDPMEQILALSSQCDATQLALTAAEGYLLSRIDGATSWRHLRQIGGIPEADVDACLTRWLDEKIVEVVGAKTEAPPRAGKETKADAPKDAPKDVPTDAATVPAIDESSLQEGLEIDLTVQRRILEFEAGLGRPYHELLGVEKGAEPKAVKRAYFKLSKEFHPDRFFRQEIGHYSDRLDRIFKKVLEAHEMLSDPDLCQVENQDTAAPIPPAASAEPVVDAASVPPTESGSTRPPASPRELSKLERLRQRMPFKINHKAIAERRAKADEIFKAACNSQRMGRLPEAEASIRIAISFDPTRAEFKEALGSLKIEAAGDRAAKLLEKPSDKMNEGELREVLKLIEDVIMYRPHDPELNERAARVCVRLSKFADAREYAETLIDRCPDVAANHVLLGKIYRGLEDRDAAIGAFEDALKLDDQDLDARRAVAAMRIGHHDAVQGGGS